MAILFTILVAFVQNSIAQRSLGAVWKVPGDSSAAVEQLELFDQMGIRYLEIDQLLPDETLEQIRRYGFRIFVLIPVRFPLAQTFAQADSHLISTYQSYFSRYAGHPSVEALGLFAYGQTGSQLFALHADPFLTAIRQATTKSLYYKSWKLGRVENSGLFDFEIYNVAVDTSAEFKLDTTKVGGYYYRPKDAIKLNITPIKWFVKQTQVRPGAVLFFDGQWLRTMADLHPDLIPIFASHAHEEDAVFPVPEERLSLGSPYGIAMLLLLFIWISVALHYSYVPAYRKGLFRYFYSHKFFVEDVIDRHIRSAAPAVIILVQHALAGGLLLYGIGKFSISDLGLLAIQEHISWIDWFGSTHISLFWLGTIGTLLIELLSILWIHLLNSTFNYLSQVAILYSWFLQINFAVITLLFTLIMAGTAPWLVYTLGGLFVVILLTAFPVMVFDLIKFPQKYPTLFGLATLAVYLPLIAGLIAWIFMDRSLINLFSLALGLP